MAVFSYLYFNSYVAREVSVTVGSVLQVRHTRELRRACSAGILNTLRVSGHAQAHATVRTCRGSHQVTLWLSSSLSEP